MEIKEAINVINQVLHHPQLKFLTVQEAVLAEQSFQTICQELLSEEKKEEN